MVIPSVLNATRMQYHVCKRCVNGSFRLSERFWKWERAKRTVPAAEQERYAKLQSGTIAHPPMAISVAIGANRVAPRRAVQTPSPESEGVTTSSIRSPSSGVRRWDAPPRHDAWMMPSLARSTHMALAFVFVQPVTGFHVASAHSIAVVPAMR
ncbi:MAG: hypothetical protein ACYCZU_04930 [Devosia sp.]